MYLWIMKKKIKIQELIQIQAVDYRIKRTIKELLIWIINKIIV